MPEKRSEKMSTLTAVKIDKEEAEAYDSVLVENTKNNTKKIQVCDRVQTP